jgi:PAS domain S-box-containing protein
MSSEAATTPLLAFAAGAGLAVAVVLAFLAVRKARSRGARKGAEAGGDSLDNSENYQLILETLDHSNILLWWARVWRDPTDSTGFAWKIRTPPQLRQHPIYSLASLADKGGLWKDEDAPDHERTARTAIKAILEGASGYQQEFRIRGTDSIHWLSEEVVVRPVGPDEWNLAGVIVDVTKRREAEEAVKQSEGQLEQILKNADCLIWKAVVTGDPQVRIDWEFFVPPSALCRKIYGEQPPAGKALLWNHSMVPEWEEIRKLSRRALSHEWPGYEQEFHINAPGGALCVQERVSITRLGDGEWSLVGVIVDITARRDAELALAAEKERLAVTLGSMREGVITIDAGGRIVFLNQAASDLLQWAPSEAVGREALDVCVLQSGDSARERVLPVRDILEAGGQAELPPKTLVKGRLGRARLVEGRLVPFADLSGRRVGAVLVLHDVTESHQMEEKLQHAAKLESVGILAGGIAHDFNNILTAIMSNLSLLQLDHAGTQDQARMIDEALRATKRAAELTNQLLTFSRGGDPVRASVSLREVITEAADFARRGSSVKSQFEIPDGLWAANVDKTQIGQVIQNLVINATQAMASGGSLIISAANEHVEPGSRPALAVGDYVRVTVTDSGVGIQAEDLGRIFDPYFTTKPQGHGLGLATVFSIISRHQGHIEVVSTVGSGTTFTIWLPAAKAPMAPREKAPLAVDAVKGGRVLFMDDEEPITRMAEKVMRRLGLDFESAADGKEAIERYRAAKEAGRPFDLVIMDLTIPGGMGGKEAISILRKYDPGVRAIVSSGYSSDLAMADFREHGFKGIVAKPYDISNLTSVINSVLRSPPGAP